jgi:hypothetical protein
LARFGLSKLFIAGVCAVFASLILDATNYARGLFEPSILSVIPIILILIGLGLIGYDFWRRMH